VSRDISEKVKFQEEIIKLNRELEKRVEKRTAELLEASEKLERQERLAILGRLTGSVSHELRNPLSSIKNSVFFLKMKIKDADEKSVKHLDIINREVDHSLKIITTMLDSIRIKSVTKKIEKINDIISDFIKFHEFPPNITLETHLDSQNPEIEVDRSQITQVLRNLVTNAIDAMPDGGMLTLSTTRDQRGVCIKVVDSGLGIPASIKEKIFNPLFTTKASGIGLGLSVVREIIEKHGGNIEWTSEQGKGTEFVISIPSSQPGEANKPI